MSKRQAIMILSVLVAVIQFMGFPSAWDKFFSFVGGILIVFIAYRMGPKVKPVDMRSMPYMEHKPEQAQQVVPEQQNIQQQ